jgi:hypothetical protein
MAINAVKRPLAFAVYSRTVVAIAFILVLGWKEYLGPMMRFARWLW